MEDCDTGEVLEFDFSRWVGEIGGDIRKELPVIKMGKGIQQGNCLGDGNVECHISAFPMILSDQLPITSLLFLTENKNSKLLR